MNHPQRMTGQRARIDRRSAITPLLALLALIATLFAPTADASGGSSSVVVANRGSGDISIIDTSSLAVSTVALPGSAEPMYVSHDRRTNTVFVGDRASSTVVAFDDETYAVKGTVAVGSGVFHQWHDSRSRQLWVVGDTSNTVTVVDGESLAVAATIDIPADLVDAGGKPHDVFVSGENAFVSVLGLSDGTGVVIQYSTESFEETGRIITGADPHLFVTANKLYVASQGGSLVSRYQAHNLNLQGSFAVPSAHGIYVTNTGDVFVTNIAGGGVDAIAELNRQLTQQQDVTDTAVPIPHNLTVDNDGQVWVTHSGGAANQVSVTEVDNQGFGSSSLVTVGTNPFGLAFVD